MTKEKQQTNQKTFKLFELAEIMQAQDARKITISGYSWNKKDGHQLKLSKPTDKDLPVYRFDYAVLQEIFDYFKVKTINTDLDTVLVTGKVYDTTSSLQDLIKYTNKNLQSDSYGIKLKSSNNSSFLIQPTPY